MDIEAIGSSSVWPSPARRPSTGEKPDEKIEPAVEAPEKPAAHIEDAGGLEKDKPAEAGQDQPEPQLAGETWDRERLAYDYELTKDRELVVKVVDKEDRSKVVRQYPDEKSLSIKRAYRKFMELIGL